MNGHPVLDAALACSAVLCESAVVADPSIRAELPADIAAIRRVNELAFGRTAEADLVDGLRRHGAVTLSLVAVLDGQVAGHILFSPVDIERAGRHETAVGLAPLAVLPELQRRGIGSGLVHAGLDRLRRGNVNGVIVLGHPEYPHVSG